MLFSILNLLILFYISKPKCFAWSLSMFSWCILFMFSWFSSWSYLLRRFSSRRTLASSSLRIIEFFTDATCFRFLVAILLSMYCWCWALRSVYWAKFLCIRSRFFFCRLSLNFFLCSLTRLTYVFTWFILAYSFKFFPALSLSSQSSPSGITNSPRLAFFYIYFCSRSIFCWIKFWLYACLCLTNLAISSLCFFTLLDYFRSRIWEVCFSCVSRRFSSCSRFIWIESYLLWWSGENARRLRLL